MSEDIGPVLEKAGACPPANITDFGAVVAVVDLVDMISLEHDSDVWYDPFATGPWCWVLDDVRRLVEPVPIVGKRRLFNVTLPEGALV